MSSDVRQKKEKAEKFLNEILLCFEGEYSAKITSIDDTISAEIVGEGLDIFTEKDGRVLEAIRILTSSVINDRESEFVKFNADADGFRQKKDEKIMNLAISTAERVKAEGDSIALPDMNSYDRRIAHMALQEDPLIRTESEGEEPHRHLVIFPA